MLPVAEFHLFLQLSSSPVCVYTRVFLMHSPVDGRISCFTILAAVHSSAVNIRVRESFSVGAFSFSGYVPRCEFLDHTAVLFSGFLRNLHAVFHNSGTRFTC